MKDIHNDVPGQSEDALQQKCYFWFWNSYPELRGLLFAVPNGGSRNAREAKKFNLTGLVSGVSDMIFLYKSKAYMLELKTETGTQSKKQQKWEQTVWAWGFDYHLIRSLAQFKVLVSGIIDDDNTK